MKPVWYLVSLIILSAVLSIHGSVLVLNDIEVGNPLNNLWVLVFALLVALWAQADAKVKEIHKSLDFPAYFFFVWPLALPYYLAITRGAEGVVLFCGFVALYFSPFMSGLITYAYFYPE